MANRKVEKFDTLEAFRSTYNETSKDIGDIADIHDVFEGVPKDIIEALGNKADRSELDALAGPLVIMGTFGEISGDLPLRGEMGHAYFCESENYWSNSGQFVADRTDMAIWADTGQWRLIKKQHEEWAHKGMNEVITGAWTFYQAIRAFGFIGDGSQITGIVGDGIEPNQIRPLHLNVPGTFRGRGIFKLLNHGDPTGAEGVYVMRDDGSPELPGESLFQERDYMLGLVGDGGVEYLNDLGDCWAHNRVVGSTLAWDGNNYVSADFPEEGRPGPEGPPGDQGPIGREPYGVPVGGIIMWSGQIDLIPINYLLCDGTMGTPDLRDRFIMGAGGSKTPGEFGGSETSSSNTSGPGQTGESTPVAAASLTDITATTEESGLISQDTGTSGSTATETGFETQSVTMNNASSTVTIGNTSLSVAQMPSHTHTQGGSGTASDVAKHSHSMTTDGIHNHITTPLRDHESRVVIACQNGCWSYAAGEGTTAVRSSDNGSHVHPVNGGGAHSHSLTLSGSTGGAGSSSAHGHSATVGTHKHVINTSAHSHTIPSGAHTHRIEVPAHTHILNAGTHTHAITVNAHSHPVTTVEHTHDTTPKFWALAYIMRIGGQPFDVEHGPVAMRKGG